MKNIPILMYHGVSDTNGVEKEGCSANPAYTVSALQFRNQIQWLADHGYQALTLNALFDAPSPVGDERVALTFDDGWANNYHHAFPVLKEFGMGATVFAITRSVGKPGYASWDELREMADAGISIQSHTVSHLPLTILPAGQLRHELSASKMCLEDHLGRKVEFLSLPHGMGNRAVYDLAEEVGYRAVCTSEPGYSHRFGPLAVLKRINVAGSYRMDDFRKIVERDGMMGASLVVTKTMKNFVKKILGYRSYRAMYRLRYGSGNKVRRSELQ